MKIEVLTVNYNTPELVKQLFLTISKHCSYELNYTVINNGPIKFVDVSSIINVLDFIPRKVKPISLKDRLKYASIEHSAVLDYLKDK